MSHPPNFAGTAQPPRSRLAVASLVLGLANVLCLFLLFIPPIVGIVLGALGIRDAR
ncbi:hypothetical protein FHX37_3842 [Haloactinospora alba]|uniref:Uncharacterized protein n=1 Tax=Haloactinospora alba TaxID=405555 RepID=A0A543N9K2_9ACTN|nr:DUF4190 domain-containing protein [Haloactinospora alba]TQN28497.1 hypothetical protein FHX37_3842 [Haloactinospora alba]